MGESGQTKELLYFLFLGFWILSRGRDPETPSAPSGNRTRVKGVEDPHSTTELSAHSADSKVGVAS
jgi:hypothetical protein